MMQARLVEIGIVVINCLFLAIALTVGLQVSTLAGVFVFFVLAIGFVPVFFNFDYPLVRRLAATDDELMLNLCRTGFAGRVRGLLKALPTDPRCRFCFVPFGGIGRLVGIKPAAKNPNYCRSCFEGLPTQTHEMKVGVLFADIRGYTSWAETHDTANAAETLSRFYEVANRTLTSDDAFVEFVGDQVMAFYPVDMPSLGENTRRIMLSAAKRLVAEVRAQPDLLPVGVGMNFGTAQVGPIAKGETKDFTAVGDVINTAARLQSSAGEFEIVLSESVYDDVRDDAADAQPRTLEVKGKSQPQKAFVLTT